MNIKRIIFLLIIFTVLNIIFLPRTLATTAGEIIGAGDEFVSKGGPESNVIDEPKLKSTSSTVYKVLLTIGICVAVIIGAVLGVQFILGSVEGKAKISEALVPYIIGCIVVFGAFTIWGFVVNMGNDVTGVSSNVAVNTPEERANSMEFGGGGGKF